MKARTNLLMSKSGLSAFLIKELREVVPPTIFFAVGFNLILLTTKLILSDYRVEFSSFMIATMMALVVGKSVLVFRRSNNYTYAQAAFFRRFFGFVHPGEISSSR